MWQSYCSKEGLRILFLCKIHFRTQRFIIWGQNSPLKESRKAGHKLGGGGSTLMVGLTIKIPFFSDTSLNTVFFLILPLWPERFFSTLFVKVWLDPPRLLSSVNPSPQMTLIKIVSTHHLPYNLSSHTYIKLEEQRKKSSSKFFKKYKGVRAVTFKL